MAVLCLCAPPEGRPDNHVDVLGSVAGPMTRCLEGAGHAFEAWNFERLGLKEKKPKGESGSAKKDKQTPDKKTKKVKEEKTKKLTDAELEQDHYAILGIKELEASASNEQIKLAYKAMVLETHPDKIGGRDDTKFKAVQLAYEVLSEPTKRKAYDSALEFDDDIPGPKVAPEQFYEVYLPVFRRNARWSSRTPVPELGTDDTPLDEVNKFYEFWFGFKSWRDFSHVDEHDTDHAECSAERRWMDRENQKARHKEQMVENRRILTMVERAFKLDPRLRRAKEAEKAEKARKQAEKREAAEAEVRKKREAEEAVQREKERVEAEAKETARLAREQAKKLRPMVRALVKPFVTEEYCAALTEDALYKGDFDWLLPKMDAEGLAPLHKELEALAGGKPEVPAAEKAAALTLVNDAIRAKELATGFDRFGQNLKQKAASAAGKPAAEVKKKAVAEEWTEKELMDLTKAIAKYPGGASSRWESMATFIGTKTADQVLRKTKEMTAQLSESTAPKKPKEIKQTDSKVSPEEAPAVKVEDLWSKAQQTELENALRDLRAYKDKDKWEKIAEKVTGKTKKQCMLRYKYLAELNKKGAPS